MDTERIRKRLEKVEDLYLEVSRLLAEIEDEVHAEERARIRGEAAKVKEEGGLARCAPRDKYWAGRREESVGGIKECRVDLPREELYESSQDVEVSE